MKIDRSLKPQHKTFKSPSNEIEKKIQKISSFYMNKNKQLYKSLENK